MNAYTFDRSTPLCPACHRPTYFPSVQLVGGLLTCPHCRSRLVISVSGHYVRDPFHTHRAKTGHTGAAAQGWPPPLLAQQTKAPTSKAIARTLRRQSRPLARILRDSGLAKYPSAIAWLSGLILLSFTLSFLSSSSGQSSLRQWIQAIGISQTFESHH